MARFVCAALVAAIVIAPSIAAAQPLPPVRLSVRTNGAQNEQASTLLGVSHNGRHVLFSTTGTLVDEDLNGHNDLYVRDRDTAASKVVFARDIAFDGVTFCYDGVRPNLDQVSFTIPKGSDVAFVGPSGCGKSTVLSMLMRMYDPQQGAVRVDGGR